MLKFFKDLLSKLSYAMPGNTNSRINKYSELKNIFGKKEG